MDSYRKKPVVIQAVKWDGNPDISPDVRKAVDDKTLIIDDAGSILVRTLEGVMRCNIGDYLIRGVDGEFYPCKASIFHKTYEAV